MAVLAKKTPWVNAAISALRSTPHNRDVRVHDVKYKVDQSTGDVVICQPTDAVCAGEGVLF